MINERDPKCMSIFMDCLRDLLSGENLQDSIEKALLAVLSYYEADRSYIFEYDYENKLASNTYEICREGVRPERDRLQNLPLEDLALWIRLFETNNCVSVENVDDLREDPARQTEYEILKMQDITRLMATPLYKNGKVIGMLGVDNPQVNQDNITFLMDLTYVISVALYHKKLRMHLEQMSYYDYLTGFCNRNAYNQFLIGQEFSRHKSIGMAFVDMNGLKQINDSLGHVYGDQAICKIAAHIKEAFPEDTVYRMGGDEFLIIAMDMPQKKFLSKIESLREALWKKNEELAAVGSIWSAITDSFNIQQGMHDAEQIMVMNKRNYYAAHTMKDEKLPGSLKKMLLEGNVRDQFCVYLQPKYDVLSGKVTGAEALIRKVDADGNVILPYEFIPLYERAMLINRIDFFVLEEVCRVVHTWLERYGKAPIISVNFSRISLSEHDFIQKVMAICDQYEIPYPQIEIEITESARAMDEKLLEYIICELNGRGFHISLDDVGERYAAFHMMTIGGLDIIKIDRKLIQNITRDRKLATLLRHIIRAAHDLSLICVAEGVENEEQLELLRGMKCDYIQGFYISHPLPIDDFEKKYML